MGAPDQAGQAGLWRLSRAAILVVVIGAYLASAFKFSTTFWTSGMGDWADPYFINYLLEHWLHSVSGLTNPASPPMFYPATGTLGYSHALILYAPFYVPFRLFLHPFQAHNLTILSVLFVGSVSLYVLCRKLKLSFVESLLVTAFFLASPNVTDGSLAVWSQRASVFLIPTLVLATLWSLEVTHPRWRLALLGFSGLATSLLYSQDFQTAHFAVLLLSLALLPLIPIGIRSIGDHTRYGSSSRMVTNAVGLTALLATIWTLVVLTYGGFSVAVFGGTIRSHDWRRPAALAVVAMVFWLWRGGAAPVRAVVSQLRPEAIAFGGGTILGAIVFAWIYARAYVEHRAFPADQLVTTLVTPDPVAVGGIGPFLRQLLIYESFAGFAVATIIVVLAWAPRSGATNRIRMHVLWCLVISVVVLLIPLQVGGFSLWREVIQPIPGFAAIRDPKRVIYLFDLAVALGAALFVSRFPQRAVVRLAMSLTLLGVLVSERHLAAFDFFRPVDDYARWIASPVTIDPRCSSFYIKAASANDPRHNTVWTTYALDAMFVSLNQGIPTINGYSAWNPSGWTLGNPTDPTYLAAVKQWAERHDLRNVCELDLHQRSIGPPVWP
jgi:hypothetical protein